MSGIETYTGRLVYPLALTADAVCIEDIAHALSLQCRFSGHCRYHYSVAQHSTLASIALGSGTLGLWGLLHDASEAYLVDIPKPVKQCLPAYRDAERRALKVIADVFGLPWPVPPEVKEIDRRMVVTEARDLMPNRPEIWDPWTVGVEPFEWEIEEEENPRVSELLFMYRFRALTNG